MALSCGRYKYEEKQKANTPDPAPSFAGNTSLNRNNLNTVTAVDRVRNGGPNSAPDYPAFPISSQAVADAGSATTCALGTFENCSECGDSCSSLTLPGVLDYACVSGSCEMVSCAPGFDNCDGESGNGCEANLNSLEHCGGCGLSCAISNASASCATGTCQLVACSAGFGDCDADLSGNGCERNLTSLTDCGACGEVCTRANGTASCATGTCELETCANGFGDCDANPVNGCESPLDTLVNCQFCATACDIESAATSSCAGGACTAAVCAAGLADCNGDGVSCETDLATLANCVGCGVTCGDANGRLSNSTATCSSGSCEVDTCDSGFDDCDSIPGNGCETPLNTLSDCSACGIGCGFDNAQESCATGACQLGTCATGFENCDAVESNGCEAAIGSDAHCGGCNLACAPTESCTSNECVGVFNSYPPSNIDTATLNPVSAPDLVLDCGGIVTLNTSSLTHNGWCGGPSPSLVIQEQASGPDVVVVTLRSLTLAAGTTLRLSGALPVAFAVFGDATIAGTLDASASGTTGGPGENWECNLSDAVNAPGGSSGPGEGGGGGGGGALGAAGGLGGGGGSGSPGGAAGIPRSSTVLSPLVPGCRGGWGGGCGDSPGGGGGAVQLSSTGQLQITGNIISDGGNGVAGCGVAGGASGGGSGGAILLEANQVVVTGSLAAGGGNGGRGANGGLGGQGSATGSGQPGAPSGTAGGGGGGGSAGRIRIVGAQGCSVTGSTLPAPNTSCS